MPELRVGDWVRNLTITHSGMVVGQTYQVSELVGHVARFQSFKLVGSQHTWVLHEVDFQVLDREDEEELEEDPEDIDIDLDIPEVRPWVIPQRPPPIIRREPQYLNQVSLWIVGYRHVNNPEDMGFIQFASRDEAEREVEWFGRNNYEILRTVEVKLGYN